MERGGMWRGFWGGFETRLAEGKAVFLEALRIWAKGGRNEGRGMEGTAECKRDADAAGVI